MALAIVIPVYGDDKSLKTLFHDLRDQRWQAEIIVVDGAASDSTRDIVADFGATYIRSEAGRGQQISTGLDQVRGGLCLILHADSKITVDMRDALFAIENGSPCWGRFDIDIPELAIVAGAMNIRSRLTKICTGDQGMFTFVELIDEFPRIPLMEDIELSRRLKAQRVGPFVPLQARIGTSPRRWREYGVLRTILTMWWFRLLFYFGASPHALYDRYYSTR